MDELKALLGDAYKEGMTLEEVGTFFTGKKFADLSTGNYVDKNKYTKDVNDLNTKLTDINNQLTAKMTDDEKAQQNQQAQLAEIERLKQLLSENTVNGNKNLVVSTLTNVRDTLGFDATNADFSKFVDNITTEDGTKSTEVAKYVSKIVKDAYEKGKQDAIKDAMGNFGKGASQGGDGGNSDKIGELGAALASFAQKSDKKTYDYFSKK